MKHHEVLQRAREFLSASSDARLTGVRIYTVFDPDRTRQPRPYVKFRLNSIRDQSGNGANPRAGFTEDGSGDKTGWELHVYHDASLVCTVAADTAQERVDILGAVFDAFVPTENRPELFHADTAEWRVGEPRWGDRDVLEDLAPQDGYSGRLTARFNYLTRGYDTADPLTSIQSDVETL
jgi:hypothetical protein